MTRQVLSTAILLTAIGTTLAADKPLLLQQVEVRDKANVGGEVAYTFRKPAGWKHEAKLDWYPFMVHQANINLKVSNPETFERMSTQDVVFFGYMENPGFNVKRFEAYYGGLYCEPMSPTKLQAKLKEHFGDKVPGKIVSQTDLPDVAEVFGKMMGMKDVQAGKTRIVSKIGNVEVEEDFYLVMTYTQSRNVGGTFYQFYPIVQPISLRAEKGKLDEATPRLLSIAYSITPTKELALAKAQGLAGLMKLHFDKLAALDALSKQISANNDAMIAMIRSERQSRWAAEDRSAKKFSDYIRGVENYTDGKYQYTVPNTHRYAWSDGLGTIYMTNEYGDDPNRSLRGSWTQLKQSK